MSTASSSVAELVIRSTGAGLSITAPVTLFQVAGPSIPAPIALFPFARSVYHGVGDRALIGRRHIPEPGKLSGGEQTRLCRVVHATERPSPPAGAGPSSSVRPRTLSTTSTPARSAGRTPNHRP